MSQAGTPQPGHDPKPGGVPLLDPQDHDEGPHPSIPQEEGPEIEETEGQPT